MDVLLTWVGRRDPMWRDPATGAIKRGPILTLLEARAFERVHLLVTPGVDGGRLASSATSIQRGLRKQLPQVDVRVHPVDLIDPTDYEEVYRAANQACQAIVGVEDAERRRLEAAGERWQYYVYLQPGTGQMQTVWVLLVESGLLAARMIASPEGRYRLESEAAWREVRLTLGDFPRVVSPGALEQAVGVLQRQNENLKRTALRLEAELEAAKTRVGQSDETSDRTTGRSGDGNGNGNGAMITPGFSWPRHRDALERSLYSQAYDQAAGDAALAARLLGVPGATFRAAAVRMGLRPRRRAGSGTA